MSAALRIFLTTTSGPGGSAEQLVPAYSLGGYAATTEWSGGALGDLFGLISDLDALSTRADYRCVYVFNPDEALALLDVRVYLSLLTDGAAGLLIGVDPRPTTYIDSLSPQAVDVATTYTAPVGVDFIQPDAYANGLVLGDLPAQSGRAIWFKRNPAASPPGAAADSADVIFESDDNVETAVVRRLVWETAPYADRTQPIPTPSFVPTSSPFLRTSVDYVTEGGARITWELDRSLVDPLPYQFQLQASQSGGDNSDDWSDVGPPGQDVTYLLDSSQRLWGASSTLHYRVVLTTSEATYISPTANVFGDLTVEQWLLIRELVRKEQLMLRRFVGVNGFLLKARRYGPICSCTNENTGEVNDSNCSSCYGVGIVGGYHPPIPLTYFDTAPTETYERVDYNESRGTVRDTHESGRALALTPIVHKDAWVAIGSDERYKFHRIRELVAFQSMPIVYSCELRMVPRSNVLYTFPVTRPVVAPPDYRTVTTMVL